MVKIIGSNFVYYVDEKEIISMTEWEDEAENINLDVYFKGTQIPQYITCVSKEERQAAIEKIIKSKKV